MTDWTPISDMPDELKDGRPVLLWVGHHPRAEPFALICEYEITAIWQGWVEAGARFEVGPATDYCEITPPKE